MDKMIGCYLINSLPKSAMRRLAGYITKPGSYCLARAALDPRKELQVSVFPDVDQWPDKFKKGKL